MGSKDELPDPNTCRNKHVFENIYECLVVKGGGVCICVYSISFGRRHYCRHPDRSVFEATGCDADTEP